MCAEDTAVTANLPKRNVFVKSSDVPWTLRGTLVLEMERHHPLLEAHFLASVVLALPPTDGAFLRSFPVDNATSCVSPGSQLCAKRDVSVVPPAPPFSCHPSKMTVELLQRCFPPHVINQSMEEEGWDLFEPLFPVFPCGLLVVAFLVRSTAGLQAQRRNRD